MTDSTKIGSIIIIVYYARSSTV